MSSIIAFLILLALFAIECDLTRIADSLEHRKQITITMPDILQDSTIHKLSKSLGGP